MKKTKIGIALIFSLFLIFSTITVSAQPLAPTSAITMLSGQGVAKLEQFKDGIQGWRIKNTGDSPQLIEWKNPDGSDGSLSLDKGANCVLSTDGQTVLQGDFKGATPPEGLKFDGMEEPVKGKVTKTTIPYGEDNVKIKGTDLQIASITDDFGTEGSLTGELKLKKGLNGETLVEDADVDMNKPGMYFFNKDGFDSHGGHVKIVNGEIQELNLNPKADNTVDVILDKGKGFYEYKFEGVSAGDQVNFITDSRGEFKLASDSGEVTLTRFSRDPVTGIPDADSGLGNEITEKLGKGKEIGMEWSADGTTLDITTNSPLAGTTYDGIKYSHKANLLNEGNSISISGRGPEFPRNTEFALGERNLITKDRFTYLAPGQTDHGLDAAMGHNVLGDQSGWFIKGKSQIEVPGTKIKTKTNSELFLNEEGGLTLTHFRGAVEFEVGSNAPIESGEEKLKTFVEKVFNPPVVDETATPISFITPTKKARKLVEEGKKLILIDETTGKRLAVAQNYAVSTGIVDSIYDDIGAAITRHPVLSKGLSIVMPEKFSPGDTSLVVEPQALGKLSDIQAVNINTATQMYQKYLDKAARATNAADRTKYYNGAALSILQLQNDMNRANVPQEKQKNYLSGFVKGTQITTMLANMENCATKYPDDEDARKRCEAMQTKLNTLSGILGTAASK